MNAVIKHWTWKFTLRRQHIGVYKYSTLMLYMHNFSVDKDNTSVL